MHRILPGRVRNGHPAVRGSDHIPGACPHSARGSRRPEVPLHPKGSRSRLLSHQITMGRIPLAAIFVLNLSWVSNKDGHHVNEAHSNTVR